MAMYLVTGCAGFIGSQVCTRLLADGHGVVGVDSINDAYDVRLKQWRLEQLRAHSQFAFHHLDISARDALRPVFTRELSGVINLAARAGVRQSLENPWVYFDANVTGTLNLLEMCREFGVRKFVIASSSSVYGNQNPRPFREDANTDAPPSPYAASKKAAEVLCHTYHELFGLDVTVLRYFTVYGPAGRPDMSIFRFVQWISEGKPITLFGDGKQERDFTFVADVARGTIAALKPLGFEIINLGADQPIVLSDVIAMIEDAVGKKAALDPQPRNPMDMLATWADIGKAKHLLAWSPQISFDDGIRATVEWYRANRAWASQVSTR
ncbi:MAG: GDP-mannose 4,6-dehydratase [Chloroflexi bacterium]|nr:GDP-mannose 4,6-dehydratase [Chloroflexota bacterium]